MHLHPSGLDELNMQCPCGARAERAYGLCRKCGARAAWRRRKARKTWLGRLPKSIRRTYEHAEEANV